MRTVAFSNRKGGSGKTALDVNLADGLARLGHRTLVVDLDGQQNATKWLLGRRLDHDEPGAPDALLNGEISDEHIYEAPGRPNLFVLPSTTGMDNAEISASQKVSGQMNLRAALKGIARKFDWCLIDCAPNMGFGTISALHAARDVLVPILPAYLTTEGVDQLELAVAQVRKRTGLPTRVSGYVLFAVDPRQGLGVEARERLEVSKVFDSEIRISTEGARLPMRRTTAWEAGEDPRGQEDYQAVLKEMMRRVSK